MTKYRRTETILYAASLNERTKVEILDETELAFEHLTEPTYAITRNAAGEPIRFSTSFGHPFDATNRVTVAYERI